MEKGPKQLSDKTSWQWPAGAATGPGRAVVRIERHAAAAAPRPHPGTSAIGTGSTAGRRTGSASVAAAG